MIFYMYSIQYEEYFNYAYLNLLNVAFLLNVYLYFCSFVQNIFDVFE